MLAWHPGKCSHIASRDRWVWKLFSCLCKVFGLDKKVSMDGSALLFHCLGSAVTKHMTRPATWVFRDLLAPAQSQQVTGVSE